MYCMGEGQVVLVQELCVVNESEWCGCVHVQDR